MILLINLIIISILYLFSYKFNILIEQQRIKKNSITTIISTICFALATIVLICTLTYIVYSMYVYYESYFDFYELKAIYNDLHNQISHLDLKSDDFVLINDISNYNQQLETYQYLQNDLWVGFMYPNVFDQLEMISYVIFN